MGWFLVRLFMVAVSKHETRFGLMRFAFKFMLVFVTGFLGLHDLDIKYFDNLFNHGLSTDIGFFATYVLDQVSHLIVRE